MYHEHFGINEPPFKITPDTRLFFTGGNRGPILDAIVYAISSGEGIVKVVGEVGSGKTMLCRMLELRLPETVDVVYLANPSLTPDHILHAIAFEMHLPLAADAGRLQVMHALQEWLLEKHAQGRQAVVFVEEAQSMPIETLEEIRLLSNLETQRHKLLQIVLFGQPELERNLEPAHIRQLRERVTHSFTLPPFGLEEVRQYIDFRMRAAGYRGPEVFTKAAVRQVAAASRGLIRRINILADKSLLAAYAESKHQVTPRHVKVAVADSDFARVARRGGSWSLLAAGLGGATAGAVGLWLLLSTRPVPPSEAGPAAVTAPVAAVADPMREAGPAGAGADAPARALAGAGPLPRASGADGVPGPGPSPGDAAPGVADGSAPPPEPAPVQAGDPAAPASGTAPALPVTEVAEPAPAPVVASRAPASVVPESPERSPEAPAGEGPATSPMAPTPSSAAATPEPVAAPESRTGEAPVRRVPGAAEPVAAAGASASHLPPPGPGATAGAGVPAVAEGGAPARPAAGAAPPGAGVPAAPGAPGRIAAGSGGRGYTEARLEATRAWLAGADGEHYSIQLMVIAPVRGADLRDNLRLGGLDPERDPVFVYRTRIRGNELLSVLLGDYPTLAEARTALEGLSPALRQARPFVRSVRNIQAAAGPGGG